MAQPPEEMLDWHTRCQKRRGVNFFQNVFSQLYENKNIDMNQRDIIIPEITD